MSGNTDCDKGKLVTPPIGYVEFGKWKLDCTLECICFV